ncbi:hypothetical protein [Pleomorphomonas sp. JP5]|uniref:hypothetical protein n=1 Tax=Pleomorphomonas sp. JP5 TaxID=2942998 RepID=UPI0020445B84|nr:hypothetical protein [Pleomorphomonas sp. JP5]MCM5556720.1 hypothetical protein [Pleomorphomonas sp. JP5]
MGLRSWFDKRASAVMSGEAQRFLISIQGADQSVLDLTMAQTLLYAAVLKSKGRDLYLMDHWIHSEAHFPTEIAGTIRMMQKDGRPEMAVGAMTWLHSSRALLYPEIRLYGRQIWTELAKATDEAEHLAEIMAANAGVAHYLEDREYVPDGLELSFRQTDVSSVPDRGGPALKADTAKDAIVQKAIIGAKFLGMQTPRDAAELTMGRSLTDKEWEQYKEPWGRNWFNASN